METNIKLGDSTKYKVFNGINNSVYYSVLDSVKEETYMAPKNSVWGFVNVSVWRSVNNLIPWKI